MEFHQWKGLHEKICLHIGVCLLLPGDMGMSLCLVPWEWHNQESAHVLDDIDIDGSHPCLILDVTT